MPPSTHSRLHGLLTSHATVFLLYALLTLPFLLLQDMTILHCDDWGFLNDMRLGMSPIPDIGNSRVFFPTFWSSMYALFGDHLAGTYLIIRVAQLVFAFSAYSALHTLRVLPRTEAVITGVLVLFAPGDHSREWWTMGHPWFATGFGFGAFLILTAMFVRDRRPILLYLATTVLLLSFGLFEIHLGLAAFIVLLLIANERRQSKRQVGPHLVLVLALALYAVLHFWQGHALDVRDNRVTAVQLDIVVLVSRYIKGFMLIMKAWGAPLFAHTSLSSAAATLVTFGCVASVLFSASFLIRRHTAPDVDAHEPPRRAYRLLLTAIPIAFVPIILVMPPSGNDIDSRTLMLASPITALTISLVMFGFAGRVSSRRSATTAIFAAGVLPLILVGMIDQGDRLLEHRRAWAQQKAMWSQMSHVAPRFTACTHVVVLLVNDIPVRRASARPMFGAGYHTLTGALRLLRNDTTLSGGLLSTERISDGPADMQSLQGPVASALHWPLPLDRTVVYMYDARTWHLHLLSRPELEKRWGLALPAYNPYTRIDTNGVNTSPWRSLIE